MLVKIKGFCPFDDKVFCPRLAEESCADCDVKFKELTEEWSEGERSYEILKFSNNEPGAI